MNATPKPTTEDVMSTRAFVRNVSDTATSKEAWCEKYTVELVQNDLRSVLCRIAEIEICPEHRWTAKDLAELFANAVNSFDAMREALEKVDRWITAHPRKAALAQSVKDEIKAALALAKGEVRS